MKILSTIWLIQVAIGLNLLTSYTVAAQIIPDGTLPEKSLVTQEGNTLKIDGGTQAGQNLFHSFQEFSVLTNKTAFFNNALEIQNIFSRVTGASISNIDGIIKANGTANLFLINPNGIFFGPNATLNIGGSFVASTAERVIFSDGFAFSTTNPQTNLLTINVPIGLGFGSIPRQIVNQSRAKVSNPLIGRTPEQELTIAGLQVKAGKTIALVGGDVILQGGYLTANGGRIEIGSVAGNNTVNISPIEKGWQLDYAGVQSFQDISFLPRTLIDTSGNIGGEIQLQGRRIKLTGDRDGSPVLAWSNTVGDGKGGDIVVKASDAIEISGKSSSEIETINSASGFRTQTDGVGSAGNIRVETKNLTLNVGGQISSSAGSIFVFLDDNPVYTGNAGDITLKTQQLNILNGGLLSTNTYTNGQGGQLSVAASESIVVKKGNLSVETIAGSSGDAGDLNLTTSQLSVNQFGKITSEARGIGNAGNINLNVNTLTIEQSARITANTFQKGKGGAVNINANESVKIQKNSALSSRTQGIGDGGDLIINTNNLNIQSAARVTVSTLGRGKAGSLNINANNLNVTDGGQIKAQTEGRGQAGNINVTASNVTVSRNARISVETISPERQITSTGDAGNITLNVGRLIIQNGGEISSSSVLGANTSSLERGKGGTVTINATDSVDVSGTLMIDDETFTSRIITLAQGTGDAGNIIINTNNLNVTDGGQINAKTENIGKAGSINVTASNVSIGKDASISVETISTGDAGNITLNTNEHLIVDQGAVIANTFSTGNAGKIDLNVGKLLVQNGGEISSGSLLGNHDFSLERGAGGTITINAAEAVEITNASQLFTLAEGTGNAGNINLNTNGQLTIDKGASITANTFSTGNAGKIDLNVGQLLVQNGGEISSGSLLGDNTSNLERGRGGTITINATDFIDVSGSLTTDDNTLTSRILSVAQGTGDAGNISLNSNNLSVRDGAEINARTENKGKAGSISVTASNLSLEEAAKISVETTSTGNAGDITLNTNGYFSVDKGASITANTSGTGDAGKITLNTNNFNIQDGAQITTSTTGEGKAGSIFVTASTFSLSNGGKLLTTTAGIQNAGDIQIQTDNLSLTGLGGGLFANTEEGSQGNGGNILVNSQTTNIQNGAIISVNSQGTGIGGNITLQGNTLTLNNQASLVAETASSQGGNINLTLNDLLLLRNQSNISATAAQFGDGGNITINAPFILAIPNENSDITANAEGGKGGNINITTQGIFGIQFRDQLTELSDITVTSKFGLQGNFNIINPNADITNRLVEFPETPVDIASLINENVCTSDEAERSSFVVTGRGGLPPNQSDPLTQNGTVDWATRSQQAPKSPVILKERSQKHHPVIRQIQGWKVEADGTIILTADASAVTPESPILTHPACQ